MAGGMLRVVRTARHTGAVAGGCLLLAIALAGCSRDSDRKAVEDLVDRLMVVLGSGEGASSPGELRRLFVDPGGIAGLSLPSTVSAGTQIDSYRISKLAFLPAGAASVKVKVNTEAGTTTLSLTARKTAGGWRLDPAIGATLEIGDVIRANP